MYAADLSSVYCNQKLYPTQFKGAQRQKLADLLVQLFPPYENEVIAGPSTSKAKKGVDVVKSIKFASHDSVEGGFLNLAQWTSSTMPPQVVYATQLELAKMVRTQPVHCTLLRTLHALGFGCLVLY